MYEEWKEVYAFDILFEVSNLGRIRTKYHGKQGYKKEYRYIEPLDNGKGYLRINIKRNGNQKTVYIHRLVAEAFVPNPDGFVEINHKDENKKNNSADNLEWCTHLYNCHYGTRNERTGRAHAKKIVCVELNKIYDSLREAAKDMDVGKTAISNCLKGRSKSCAGYSWRYADVQ